MARQTRSELMSRFRDMVRNREPIIGGGAGTGISAKWEEAGGIDLIVIGSHEPGMLAYVIGSNASAIVRRAKCSVLVVR